MSYNQKNLLLSIHTKYALQIVNGRKTIELRRRFPMFKKEDKKKIFIYACSPVSKIIGWCDLKEVKKMPLKKLWIETSRLARVDYVAFQEYFKNCNFGFALYLKNPVEYKKPIDLKSVFGANNQPPQSYRYISHNLVA